MLLRKFNMTLIKRKYLFVLIITLSAIFLRFFKLADIFYFNIDEDWYNYIVRRIVVEKRPVLIGWEIPGGIFTPPVMYYVGAIVMFLFNSNPIGFAITASVTGVISVLLVYFVGKKIFNSEKIAVYSSVIYCFSFFINIYNRLSITLHLSPVVALLTYYSLFKIVKEKKHEWLVALSFILIFATQEGSMTSLIILTIVCLLLFKTKIRFKLILISLGIFLSSFIPILIFDLRHNFQILHKFINFISPSYQGLTRSSFIDVKPFVLMFRSLSRTLLPTGPADLNKQILPCKSYLDTINSQTPTIFVLLGFFLILFFILKLFSKKSVFGQKIVSLHLLVISLGLIFYSLLNPGHLYEWFFIVLTPGYCYIAAFTLNFISKSKRGKILTMFLFLIFIAVNVKYLLNITSNTGYKNKIAAVRYIVSELNNSSFSLDTLGNGCNAYGFRYLFTYLNKEPVKSYIDDKYAGWLYPKAQITNSDFKVYIVPVEDLDSLESRSQYILTQNEAVKRRIFGDFDVLITCSIPDVPADKLFKACIK